MLNKTIGVVGLGYVGLPLAMAFSGAGFNVVGVESNPKRRENIRNGINYINEKRLEPFKVSADFDGLSNAGAVFICVPTPLTKNKEPDTSYIEDVCELIALVSPLDQLVVLESTSYPGTTEEVVAPIFKRHGRLPGQNFNLAFSPERVDPGNKAYNLKNTPKIVGGVTLQCTERAVEYYKNICDTVIAASSPKAAEMEKLLENTFRSVNIALVNEMALLCDRMGLDIWEIIRLAATKPYGFMPFYPGPGVGGHCIPVDPAYLSWKAKEYDFRTRFIELASEINEHMPHHVVNLVAKALNSRYKSIRGSSILVLGVAYKPESSDWRVSPALKVMELLEKEGASVYYNDPYVKDVKDYAFLELEHIKNVDCAVICTAHKTFDYKYIFHNAPILLDTRGVAGKGQRTNKVFTL